MGLARACGYHDYGDGDGDEEDEVGFCLRDACALLGRRRRLGGRRVEIHCV